MGYFLAKYVASFLITFRPWNVRWSIENITGLYPEFPFGFVGVFFHFNKEICRTPKPWVFSLLLRQSWDIGRKADTESLRLLMLWWQIHDYISKEKNSSSVSHYFVWLWMRVFKIWFLIFNGSMLDSVLVTARSLRWQTGEVCTYKIMRGHTGIPSLAALAEPSAVPRTGLNGRYSVNCRDTSTPMGSQRIHHILFLCCEKRDVFNLSWVTDEI